MSLSSAVRPKQRYSMAEGYLVTVMAARSVGDFRRQRQSLGAPFVERIMLAVTEVNGCPVCSYGHAKLALQAGLPEDKIRQMFDGNLAGAPTDELPALLFAQHYADSKGRPEPTAWKTGVDAYGEAASKGILGAIRMIMWGNAYGIPLSGLQARRRGEKLAGASLVRDLAMTAAALGAIAMPHGFFRLLSVVLAITDPSDTKLVAT